MAIEQIAHILSLLSWAALTIVCLPPLYRLLRNRSKALDPMKSAMFFVALSQLDNASSRGEYGVSLWQYRNVPWWTFSGIVLSLSVLTLIVIIIRTDKALRSIS